MSGDLWGTMSRWLPGADPAVAARVVALSSSRIRVTLEEVGFSSASVDEVVAHWDDARRDETLAGVLAQVVTAVEAARGAPDTPLAIWDDPHDEGPTGGLFYYYVIAACVPGTREHLRTAGVPDEVVASTFASFVRHERVHRQKWGSLGIDAGWWQLLALRGELLEIGRLQYHLVRLARGTLSPEPWYDEVEAAHRGPGFRPGDDQIGLHVPAGPGFTPGAVEESLARAREVLTGVWPARQRRLASCASWLLDERLARYLEPSSNILAFQRRFTMVAGGVDDDADTLEFVFRRPGATLDQLPQRTRLERAIVAHLSSGGHWRSRTGWFDFDGPAATSP